MSLSKMSLSLGKKQSSIGKKKSNAAPAYAGKFSKLAE